MVKQKRFLFIITLLLFVVLGVLLYAHLTSRKSVDTLEKQPGTLAEKDLSGDTKNWKVYENKEWGISFNYPPEATLQETSRDLNGGLELNIKGSLQGWYWIRFYKLSPPSNLEEWIKNGTHYNLGMRDWSLESKTVNGYENVTARGYDVDCNTSASFISDGKERVVYIYSYDRCFSSPNSEMINMFESLKFSKL